MKSMSPGEGMNRRLQSSSTGAGDGGGARSLQELQREIERLGHALEKSGADSSAHDQTSAIDALAEINDLKAQLVGAGAVSSAGKGAAGRGRPTSPNPIERFKKAERADRAARAARAGGPVRGAGSPPREQLSPKRGVWFGGNEQAEYYKNFHNATPHEEAGAAGAAGPGGAKAWVGHSQVTCDNLRSCHLSVTRVCDL